jgi:hypothetical protein
MNHAWKQLALSCGLSLGYLSLTSAALLIAAEPAAPAKEPAKPAAAKVEWTSLFDGKTLQGWTAPNFGPQGEVEIKDGAILLNFGDGITGVTIDKKVEFPTAGYEIELSAQRIEGNDFFCGLTFPVNKNHATFVVGGWGGTVVGISNINGQDAANNDTATFMEFKTKQWYKIRVRVIPERITTWIDDKEINDVDIRKLEIDVRPEVELSKPVGISSWKTTASVKDIKYRKLSDAEKKAALPKDE